MKFDTENLDRLFRYCMSLTRHREDALDLMHTAVEKFLGVPEEQINQPWYYLRRIARNHFYDRQRHLQRFPETSLDETDNDSSAGFSERDLESIVIDQITLARIWQNLSAADRETLYLWAAEGMSTSEIALHLGQPRGTVLSRLHRLRKRIQPESSDSGAYHG